MNKVFVLVACFVIFGLVEPAFGERIVKTSDENSTSWRIYGSILKHPDATGIFTYNDIFVLKVHQRDNGKAFIKFKPVEMKNREWKQFRTNGLDFEIYPQDPDDDDTEYYCAIQEFKHESGKSNHMIVISPLAGHNGEYIAIQFSDLTSRADADVCENVSLPSHGGLAHAHVVR